MSKVRIPYHLSVHQYFLPYNSSYRRDFRWAQNNTAEGIISHCFRIQSEQYRAEKATSWKYFFFLLKDTIYKLRFTKKKTMHSTQTTFLASCLKYPKFKLETWNICLASSWTAIHCTAIYCTCITALNFNVLHNIAQHYNERQNRALHYYELHWNVLHCHLLQSHTLLTFQIFLIKLESQLSRCHPISISFTYQFHSSPHQLGISDVTYRKKGPECRNGVSNLIRQPTRIFKASALWADAF